MGLKFDQKLNMKSKIFYECYDVLIFVKKNIKYFKNKKSMYFLLFNDLKKRFDI